jgi:hypothetical protein
MGESIGAGQFLAEERPETGRLIRNLSARGRD